MTPLEPLVLEGGFQPNIDFKFANKFIDNLMIINSMFPNVIKLRNKPLIYLVLL